MYGGGPRAARPRARSSCVAYVALQVGPGPGPGHGPGTRGNIHGQHRRCGCAAAAALGGEQQVAHALTNVARCGGGGGGDNYGDSGRRSGCTRFASSLPALGFQPGHDYTGPATDALPVRMFATLLRNAAMLPVPGVCCVGCLLAACCRQAACFRQARRRHVCCSSIPAVFRDAYPTAALQWPL